MRALTASLCGVEYIAPADGEWLATVKQYENEVLLKR
jgi:L-rhamnose isomerase